MTATQPLVCQPLPLPPDELMQPVEMPLLQPPVTVRALLIHVKALEDAVEASNARLVAVREYLLHAQDLQQKR